MCLLPTEVAGIEVPRYRCLRSVVMVTEERAILYASSTDACDTVVNARCRGCGLTHSLLKALQALLLKLMELV